MITLPPRWLAIGTLCLGIGLAYYATTSAQAYIAEVEAANTTSIPIAPVVTFAGDFPKGHVVQPSDVVSLDFATSSIPKDAAQQTTQVVGHYLARDVVRGEPVLLPFLSQEPVEKEPVTIRVRRGVVVTEEEVPS